MELPIRDNQFVTGCPDSCSLLWIRATLSLRAGTARSCMQAASKVKGRGSVASSINSQVSGVHVAQANIANSSTTATP